MIKLIYNDRQLLIFMVKIILQIYFKYQVINHKGNWLNKEKRDLYSTPNYNKLYLFIQLQSLEKVGENKHTVKIRLTCSVHFFQCCEAISQPESIDRSNLEWK